MTEVAVQLTPESQFTAVVSTNDDWLPVQIPDRTSEEARALSQAEIARQTRILITKGVAGEKLEAGEELTEEDHAYIADTFEGEADDLAATLNSVLRLIQKDKFLIEGIEKEIDRLKHNMERAEKRIEFRRGVIEQAMVHAGCVGPGNGLRVPLATLSVSTKPPTVVVDSEVNIPTRYFIEQPRPDPKVDKKALNKDVLARYKAELDADAIPDPDKRKAAFEKIIADFGLPVPGVHVETGGYKLNVRG